ncbi:M23 family metallopeptidase [Pedobacter miscanthi]|uniref:M23 family metallopeptidase n=1 Tax=Pedobacter miscanthi TaxID=2259170 RepID=UPI00244D6307|nr:M23 family metallopeptidase [Pedobacter miscanthi]
MLEVVLLFSAVAHAQSFDKLRLSLPLREFKINSGFGNRTHPVSGKKNSFHSGVDLHARSDSVFSILPGKVVRVSFNPLIGNYILIIHGGFTSVYGHLSKFMVVEGDFVGSGSAIGISGNTGRSTGEHLHFGLKHNGKFIDPLRFLYLFANLEERALLTVLSD